MTFPAPEFAWAFAAALLGGMVVACWHDFRSFRLPKWVTLGMLAAGVLVNLIRGGWVGAQGAEAWTLGANGAVIGVLDGGLFSLAGFAVGFGLFFVLWLVGTGGGGDVKIAAATAAWVGPLLFLFVLLVALVAVVILTVARIGTSVFAGQPGQSRGRLGIGYSLPLTIGVAVLLVFLVFGIQIRFTPRGG